MQTWKVRERRLDWELKGRPPCRHLLIEREEDDDFRPTGNVACLECGKSAPREGFYDD